jgi:signal transduction histidine kinase/CheY-like chemotaxis protein
MTNGAVNDSPTAELLIPEDVLGIGTGTDLLIVDDSDTNLTAYEAALSPLGRNLVLARSGVEALGRLLDRDFALVILDFAMPGMTGIETARMVRKRPRSKGTPILFISGASPSTETILEAFEVGALDFISKPIVPDVLRAKVAVYLQLQERTQTVLRNSVQLRDAYERLERSANVERERDAAHMTAVRLEKLQEVTTALADARSPDEVARVVVELGCAAVGAKGACMWMVCADGSLAIAGSHGFPSEYIERWRSIPPEAQAPAMLAVRRREAIWSEPDAAALPLVYDDRSVGAITFTYEGRHTFTAEERRFLLALTRACEIALERASLNAAEAEARRAAETANMRKDEFLAMLGHELRNPLAVMVSAVEILRIGRKDAEEKAAILERQLVHLTHIVDDLIDVSRITRGDINLRREAVHIASVVAMAIETVQPDITRLEHELVVNVPENVLLDADRHRLAQVLTNLLSNAIKYTPRGGRIELTAEPREDSVRMIVRDNGRGISAALLSNLFELFVQGDRGLDRRDGGLGVGLTLVRTLVHLHGGTIHANSDGPGKGATFTVDWPRASRRTITQEIPVAVVADSTRRALRVLIVDDNSDAAELLATTVESMGHTVAVAHHPNAALAIATDFAPDIALLDIGLPDFDGYELGRRLRALPSCSNTALIAVTGYGQPEDHARSRSAGFAHHFVKPLQMDMLRSVLSAFQQLDSGRTPRR